MRRATTTGLRPASNHARRRPTGDDVVVALVALAACLVTVVLVRRYLAHWEQLWTDLIHDRSGHLDFGLQPASDLLHLRAVGLLHDLNAFRSWPPLHDGVLVGVAMLVTGLDPRAAVLPSAAAFAGTAVLALVLTRRLLPRWGNLGGAFAATLVLVSPALRAFSTDVMIESSGAFWTLLVLYAAVRVRQGPSVGAWRFLALALSALFFTKYNYWLIAALATIPCVWSLRTEWRRSALPSAARWSVRVTVGLLVLVAASQGFLGSTAVRATTVAAWIALVAALVWSRTTGAVLLEREAAIRMLFRWQALPVLVWFCLPGKLQSFLWFSWPFTNGGNAPSWNPFGGVGYYAGAFASDYHASAWIAGVVGVLVICAVISFRRGRLRPGAAVVMLFVVLSLVVTVPHPNRKSRFMLPVMPAVWVVAGAGLGASLDLVARRRAWVALVAAGALVAWQVPALAATAHAPEGGVHPHRPSALALTDAYLPQLASAHAPAIVSNIPLGLFARWTYQERYDRATRPVTDIPGFDPAAARAANARALERWLASGAVDVLVLVNIGRSSPWYVEAPGTKGLRTLTRLMHSQATFVESGRTRVGRDTDVEIWVPAGARPEA